mmetsp:Transcript_49280/g.148345  ORF Transcript_49280/g.148345 Transcript_49280/m.148345 type:complete len:102 (-) Transcript_49280:1079-1384(-)
MFVTGDILLHCLVTEACQKSLENELLSANSPSSTGRDIGATTGSLCDMIKLRGDPTASNWLQHPMRSYPAPPSPPKVCQTAPPKFHGLVSDPQAPGRSSLA